MVGVDRSPWVMTIAEPEGAGVAVGGTGVEVGGLGVDVGATGVGDVVEVAVGLPVATRVPDADA